MKKHIRFTSIMALSAMTLWSCGDKGPDQKPTPEPEDPKLELTSPADEAAFNLDAVESVSFAWKADEGIANYKLLLSANDKVTRAQEIAATANPFAVTAEDLDAKMAALEMEAGKESTVYWSIVPAGSEKAETFVRSIKVTRKVTPELTAPAAGVPVILDYKKTADEAVKFEWVAPGDAFTFEISAKADMSDPIVSEPVAATTLAFSNAQLQALIEDSDNGLKRFKDNKLYWNVKKGSEFIDDARDFTLGGYRVFTDVRGDESITYEVAVLTYKGGKVAITNMDGGQGDYVYTWTWDEEESQHVWLASNFCGTKYNNGTDIEPYYSKALTDDAVVPDGYPAKLAEHGKRVYLNLGIRTNTGAKFPTTLPAEGWKIPSLSELGAMFEAAKAASATEAAGAMGVVCHSECYPANTATTVNLWNMNMGAFGRGTYDNSKLSGGALDGKLFCYMHDNSAEDHPAAKYGPGLYVAGWTFEEWDNKGKFWWMENQGMLSVRMIYTGDDE